eukprot:14625771-Heterocapsa_arctica.AAC.1
MVLAGALPDSLEAPKTQHNYAFIGFLENERSSAQSAFAVFSRGQHATHNTRTRQLDHKSCQS